MACTCYICQDFICSVYSRPRVSYGWSDCHLSSSHLICKVNESLRRTGFCFPQQQGMSISFQRGLDTCTYSAGILNKCPSYQSSSSIKMSDTFMMLRGVALFKFTTRILASLQCKYSTLTLYLKRNKQKKNVSERGFGIAFWKSKGLWVLNLCEFFFH